jgi:hypothetical protein
MGEVGNPTGTAAVLALEVDVILRIRQRLRVRADKPSDPRVTKEGDRTNKRQAASKRLRTTDCALAAVEALGTVAALAPPGTLADRAADRDWNAEQAD